MFRRRERIGQGWLGALYSGEDQNGRAFRLIPIYQLSPLWIEEVQRRHRLMSSRLVHRALPSLGVHSIAGEAYWVGGWRNGVSLFVALRQYQIPYPVLMAIGKQIVSILIQAKEVGVVHGDLQPSAIWLTANGEVWIDGFGQLLFGSDVPIRMANRRYNPPSAIASEKGDVFSLGTIIVEAMLQERKFEAGLDAEEHQQHLWQLDASLKTKKIPKALIQQLMKLLAFDERNRPSLEKLQKKWDVSSPEEMVHSWLVEKYPMIFSSGAPEQKIPQLDKKFAPKSIALADLDKIEDFQHEIGNLDVLFQEGSLDSLPSDLKYDMDHSDDCVDFEEKWDDNTEKFDVEITLEESEEDSFDDKTEVANSDDDFDSFSDDVTDEQEHTQAIRVLKEEDSFEDFFSAEVTQQLHDEMLPHFSENKPKKRKYIWFVLPAVVLSALAVMLLQQKPDAPKPIVEEMETQELEQTAHQEPLVSTAADNAILDDGTDMQKQDTVVEIAEKQEEENIENNRDNTEKEEKQTVISAPTIKKTAVTPVIESKKQIEKTSFRKDNSKKTNREEAALLEEETKIISFAAEKEKTKEASPEKSKPTEISAKSESVEDKSNDIWGVTTTEKVEKNKEANPWTGKEDVPVQSPIVYMGTVEVTGNVEKLRLVKDGRRYAAGALEIGTYNIEVTFTGLEATIVGKIQVKKDHVSTIACDSMFAVCKVIE